MKNKHQMREEILLRLVSNQKVMERILSSSSSMVEVGDALLDLTNNIVQSYQHNV